MGINAQTAQFLRVAVARGASFKQTITLGRQYIFEDGDVRPADDLFADLGAERLDALDASDFEGASVVHDLNDPVPEHLKAQFSVVFDGGTLEHVFNAGLALRNCLQLVAPGGHYIAASPGNNQMGHGFYQFSPEFYYRALSRDVGFEVDLMLAVERRPLRSHWYKSLDPAECNRRIELRSTYPVELLISARRVSHPAPATMMPQQSDYVAAWHNSGERKPSMKRQLYGALPAKLQGLSTHAYWAYVRAANNSVLMRRSTSWSSGGFERIKPADFLGA